MALSVGQTIGKTTAAAAASVAGSFGTLPTAGSAVFVHIGIYDNTNNDTHGVASVTDNQGNTYSLLKDQLVDTNRWAVIYWCSSIGSPSGTYTITVTGGNATTNWIDFSAEEVSGWAGTRTAGTPTSKTDGVGSTSVTTNSVTTSNANAYVAAVAVYSAAQGGGTTPPAGYNQRYVDNSNLFQPSDGEDKILTATGTESPSWTLTTSAKWATVLVAVEDVVAAGFNPGWATGATSSPLGGVR